MALDFYYDKYADVEDLTYSVICNKKNGESVMVLKDYIKEPLSASISHTWSNEGTGISSFLTNLKTTFAEWGVSTEAANNMLKSLFNEFGGDYDLLMQSRKSWTDYYKTYRASNVNIPLTFQCILLKGGPCPDGLENTPTAKLYRILDFFAPRTNGDDSTGITYAAPHGYSLSAGGTAGLKERATVGTLSLKYGHLFLERLLLSSFDYTISKERCEGEPLYITVNFSLIPALTLTVTDLEGTYR